jgi:uncharacterized protein (TIGR02145 family)
MTNPTATLVLICTLLCTLLCVVACEQQKSTFTDTRDGKIYKTTKIGEQVWFAENLNYEADSSICYDNKPKNCDKYGRLYNWEAAMKACPKGWHLPSDEEWNVLMKFVNPSCSDNYDCECAEIKTCEGAGIKLKATNGWDSYQGKSGNGTDDFGFAVLPGGSSYSDGSFGDVGYSGLWWSASEHHANYAYYRYIYHYGSDVYWSDYGNKDLLFSVRCLQDQ